MILKSISAIMNTTLSLITEVDAPSQILVI